MEDEEGNVFCVSMITLLMVLLLGVIKLRSPKDLFNKKNARKHASPGKDLLKSK